MNKDNLLLNLLLVFAPLSMMTIGGGVSILGDIQRNVVDHQHWLTNQGFLDVFAISRVAPGPGTLIVTLIGWNVAGWLGAVVATIAIFVPSSLLVYAIAYLWHNHPGAVWQKAVARGLAPLAAGLVLSSVFSLLRDAKGGWIAWLIALTVALATTRLRLGALPLMAIGSVLFLVIALATGQLS